MNGYPLGLVNKLFYSTPQNEILVINDNENEVLASWDFFKSNIKIAIRKFKKRFKHVYKIKIQNPFQISIVGCLLFECGTCENKYNCQTSQWLSNRHIKEN